MNIISPVMEGDNGLLPEIKMSGTENRELQTSFLSALIAQILTVNQPGLTPTESDNHQIIPSSDTSFRIIDPDSNSIIIVASPLQYPSYPVNTVSHLSPEIKVSNDYSGLEDIKPARISVRQAHDNEDLTGINNMPEVHTRLESIHHDVSFDNLDNLNSNREEISRPMRDHISPLERAHIFPENPESLRESNNAEKTLSIRTESVAGDNKFKFSDQNSDADSLTQGQTPFSRSSKGPDHIEGTLDLLKTEIRTEQGSDSQRSGSDPLSTQGHNNPYSIDLINNGSSVKDEWPTESSKVSIVTLNEQYIHEPDSSAIRVTVEHDGLGELDIKLVLDRGVINGQIKTPEINTADLIIRNIPDIINSLMRDGLNIGYLSVSLRDGGSKGNEMVYDTKKSDDRTGLTPELSRSSNYYQGYINIFV